MATKLERNKDAYLSRETLENYADEIKSGNALLLIHQDFGKGLTDYLRITLAYSDSDGYVKTGYLTWAFAKHWNYPFKERNGYNYVALSGYGYSKADEIARHLAHFYGVDRIRYELN